MSSPDDPLAMFTSASWQCPVCARRGDLHDERCLVLEIAQVAQRRKHGNRRLVQTNGRLRERADAAEAEVRRLTEGLREIEELCAHWELHDKTDPDEHERWKKAAIARAKMVGDKARALLAASPPRGGGAK